MTALWVVLAVVVVVVLLAQLRIGVSVDYGETGLHLFLRLIRWNVSIYPPKPRKKSHKPGKPSHRAQEKPREEKPEKKDGSTLARVRQALPVLCEAAQVLPTKLLVERISLQILWGADNPAAAAIGYGSAHGVVGVLWPMLAGTFTIREKQIQIALDPNRTQPAIQLNATLTMKVGQLVGFGVVYGIKLLYVWGESRRSASRTVRRKRHERAKSSH